MNFVDLLHIISVIASSNGLLVALVLAIRNDRRSLRLRLTFGGYLFLTSVLLGLFVLLDRGLLVYSPLLGAGMDISAILLSCLFLDYVATLSRGRGFFQAYLPVAIYVLVLAFSDGRPGEPTDMRLAVFTQILLTASAFAFYVHALRSRAAGWRYRPVIQFLPVLFAGLGLLHVTQVARIIAPEATALFDLVPLTGAIYLITVLVYALVSSRILGDLVKPVLMEEPQTDLKADLHRELVVARLFLDPDLSLNTAAKAVGVDPRALSTFLNQHEGQSFRRYLNSLRIAEAQRLLTSSDEAATSIEAIALLCGFRSRSSFYEAFRLETGMSPQQYRERVGAPG